MNRIDDTNKIKKEIPVVIAFDENYITPACVMLSSLFLNAGKWTTYKVFIFSEARVRSIAQSKVSIISGLYPNHVIEWFNPNTDFDGAKNRKHLTNPNYYRFLIPSFLPDYEKIIWIDVDTLIRGDLVELYETNLSDHLLGAVRIGLESAGVNEITSDDYFNAGVLLIHNQLWIREKIVEKLKKLIFSHHFKCPTQDPLNIICHGRTLHLGTNFNTLVFGNAKKENIQKYILRHGYTSFDEMKEDATILHYVGEYKPWNYAKCYGAEEWMQYHKMLPLSEFPVSYLHKGRTIALFKTMIRLLSLVIPVKQWRRSFRDYCIEKIHL
ncbi:MAG: glycosyltransferase family 8 protein [Coraliomargaritaceae bacterium]